MHGNKTARNNPKKSKERKDPTQTLEDEHLTQDDETFREALLRRRFEKVAAAFGGRACRGEHKESRRCNTQKCPGIKCFERCTIIIHEKVSLHVLIKISCH